MLERQASAQTNVWIAGRDPALFVLSWSGMLRSAEAQQLDWADVLFAPKGVMLYIPFSTTDQVGEGAWVFPQDQPGPLGVVSLMKRLQVLQPAGAGCCAGASFHGGEATNCGGGVAGGGDVN